MRLDLLKYNNNFKGKIKFGHDNMVNLLKIFLFFILTDGSDSAAQEFSGAPSLRHH